MPVINTSVNSSMIVSSGSFVDFNLWLVLFGSAIILMIVSRVFKDEIGKLMTGILSFLLALASTWTSLSVAKVEFVSSITNQTVTYTPAIQPMSSVYLTLLCVIITILCVLNLIDILSTFLNPPQPRERDRIKINGAGLRFR
jgi:hypothetical protein